MNDANAAPAAVSTRLALADFVLDFGSDELRDARGERVELRPQAWAVLRHLARNAGRLVTKDELLATIWPGVVVTDGSLVQAIGDVRRALDDNAHRLIKTIPRRGYTLVADAVAQPAKASSEAREAREPNEATQREGRSIAVLAFTDPRPDANDPWLARGMAQDLVVELIDSADGRIAWSSQHQVDGANVLAVRDALVRRIAGTVHAKTRHADMRRTLLQPPKTLDVYTLTTYASALAVQWRPEPMRAARALFEQALAIDAEYSHAWASLGLFNVCDALWRITGEWTPRHAPQYMAQLQRAIALDPDSSIAYRGLALAHAWRANSAPHSQPGNAPPRFRHPARNAASSLRRRRSSWGRPRRRLPAWTWRSTCIPFRPGG